MLAVDVDSHSTSIEAVSSDKMVLIWSVAPLQGLLTHSTFVLHGSMIYDLKAIPSKRDTRFVTRSIEQTLKMWQLREGKTAHPTDLYCKDYYFIIL